MDSQTFPKKNIFLDTAICKSS